MEPVKLLSGLLLLELVGQLAMVSGTVDGGSTGGHCNFQAVYNFGDSNSDTGAISAALSQVLPPNGESFFGTPSGRFCDGRLLIDFIGKLRFQFTVVLYLFYIEFFFLSNLLCVMYVQPRN